MTENKITLEDFWENNSDKINRIFWSSIGYPMGQEINWDEDTHINDFWFLLDGEIDHDGLWHLEGTVADGRWEWDGQGGARDNKSNSLCLLYVDTGERPDCNACKGPWTIKLWDEGGAEEEIESDDEPTRQEAERECREWYSGNCGDYDFDAHGARVVVCWQILDPEGAEQDYGQVEIDIPPDHEALIRDEAGDRGCGIDPDDHDWTSEGEGGCDSNPGVWATGGTSMSISCHCRCCGLRRMDYSTGSQCNPDDHDTVEYDMPDTWCIRCQSDDHDADDCPNH
jgi:hypothetical protein